MRDANLNPAPFRLAGPKLKDLKSDVKKATAFSKKIKLFSGDQVASIVTDLNTINVSMFISEVAQSLPLVLYEGKLKTADLQGYLQVWSQLHQKYDKFLPDALANLKKGFLGSLAPITTEMETKFDITAAAVDVAVARQSIRVWCELWLCGIIPAVNFVDTVLAKIITTLEAKPTHHVTLNGIGYVLLILKTCGPELEPAVEVPAIASAALPPSTREGKGISEPRQKESQRVGFTKEQERSPIMKKLNTILDKSLELSTKLKKQVEGQWRNLAEATELRGEASPEVKEKFAKVKGEVEKFIILTNQLAISLRREEEALPDIDLSLVKSSVDESIVFQSGLQDYYNVKDVETVNRFDDQEQRSFYENLPDIEEHLVTKQTTLSKVGATGDAIGASAAVSQAEKAELDYTTLENLFSKLHQSAAREYIDGWMVEFLTEAKKYFVKGGNLQQAQSFYDNAMKMLVGELRFAPSDSTEMLPYLSRVIATFNQYISDFGETIASKLEGEVSHAIREKQQNSYMRKMRGVKYIAELVKFRVAPPIRAIRLMNLAIEEFPSTQSVEMVIALVENVGPFLMRGGVTKEKMCDVLSNIDKALKKTGVPSQYEPILENAIAVCKRANNPSAGPVVRKGRIRTPLEQYVRYLLLSALSEATFFKVRAKVRTLPWTSAREADVCVSILRKAYLCSWDSVHLVAELVADVSDVHGWVGVNVVDSVIESLRMDLEHPDSRSQQKRLQDIKYLGELFNFRLLNEQVLCYILAQMILYHPDGNSPTDYSRIRCVCMLLETSGPYLYGEKLESRTRRRLAPLLTLFFKHVHEKVRPLPLDLDYKLMDTVSRLQDAFKAVKETLKFPSTGLEANADVVQMKSALASAKGGVEAWVAELIGTLEDAVGSRIYAISRKMAPAEMETDDDRRQAGPRSTPIESKRVVEDETFDEEDEEDDDSSSYSDSSDSSYSSEEDSEDDSSEEESSEEEEDDQTFVRGGVFTKGGNWSQAKPSAAISEDDKEFFEMLLEAKREASKVDLRRAAGKQSVDRTVEERLPSVLQPFVQKASDRAKKLATQPEGETIKFALLRRNQDKIDARPVFVPSASEFAQRTAQTQSAEEREKAELASQVLQMERQQRENELAEQRAAMRFRGRGGRGRSYR